MTEPEEIAHLAATLAARYPLVSHELEIAGRGWRILAIEDQDRLLDAAERLEHVPYGLLLWESALALARWLAAEPALVRGRRVLELGGGVGLAGIVARHLGAAVWQTDHQQDALSLARINAHANGVAGLRQFPADWRSWEHDIRYDVILGADILYETQVQPWLVPIFRANLVPGGRLLLADPDRPQALAFLGELEQQGLRVAVHTESVRLPGSHRRQPPVEVALIEGWWSA
jgi:predicted nicotinamide N-methyase